MKNNIPGIILITVLTIALVTTFAIQSVKAPTGTIYILADGTVQGTSYIQTTDNVTYVFTADINDSIVVLRNNVIIDGNGYALQLSPPWWNVGEQTPGIDLSQRTNVTVKNTQIESFRYGIFLNSSSSNMISRDNISDSALCVELISSSNNDVSECVMNNTGYGVELISSSSNIVSGNRIICQYGVWLDSSSSNSISGNNVSGHFGAYGIGLTSSLNNSISNNNVTAYLVGGPTWSGYTNGIWLGNSSDDNVVFANNVSKSQNGIYAYSASNHNSISGNNVIKTVHGIYIDSSSNCSVSGNSLSASDSEGVRLYSSTGNIISGNVVKNGAAGLYLVYSPNNTVSENNLTANNNKGMWAISSSDNKIYHNIFNNYGYEVSISESSNVWDDGYPSGGNYWSDYLTKYPYATEIDSAGIWNTPYVIDANNTDYYPLGATARAPVILIQSPENMAYDVTSVPLTFTLDQTTSWMGYSLDGHSNMTVSGNTTLTDLADGVHNVIVFANNTANMMGISPTTFFTIQTITIPNVSQSPITTNVTPIDVVSVNATVADKVRTVTQVSINYTNGNGTWTTTSMANLQGDIWNSVIPAFPYGTSITYMIVATDSIGNTVTTQQLGYTFQYAVVPEFGALPIVFLFLIVTLLAVLTSTMRKRSRILDVRKPQRAR